MKKDLSIRFKLNINIYLGKLTFVVKQFKVQCNQIRNVGTLFSTVVKEN